MSIPQVELSVRLPVPQRDKLRSIADRLGVSMNDVLRQAVARMPHPDDNPEENKAQS